jgi:predicted aspartyl protease
VRRQFAYDDSYDPPAPILPVRIGSPGGDGAVLLPGLADSGADCTLIPPVIVRRLRLPRIGHIELTGLAGGGGRAALHAAFVEIAHAGVFARLAAFGSELIVGRDLLNRIVALLDGPRLRLRLPSPQR